LDRELRAGDPAEEGQLLIHPNLRYSTNIAIIGSGNAGWTIAAKLAELKILR